MTLEDKVHAQRLRLFRRAEELGNVSAACREAGVARSYYYRLQGPNLLIEWDNTQRGANHAHSVWRDPSADFGLDVLAAHHARHHQPR